MAEAVVDVVGIVGAEVMAGTALLTTTAVVEDAEGVELVVEASTGVADAAQAHTALAAVSTARPVTGPQPLRTPERAAVLIATVDYHE